MALSTCPIENHVDVTKDPIIESLLENNIATKEQIDTYKDSYLNGTYAQFGLRDDSYTPMADVYLTYNDYFSNVSWITRNGLVSLSITPKSGMFSDNGNVAMARAFHSFSLLKERFGSDSRWKNEGSLSAQYHCHFMFAGMNKTPWNLEPHRTETNPWSWNMITKRCNP